MNKLTNYKVITVTHKTANLNRLGDFVVKQEGAELKGYLEYLKSSFQIDELVYLSTCNRVLYLFSTPEEIDEHFVKSFLTTVNPNFPNEDLKHRISNEVLTLEGVEAINHLYEVAASIDSLVVGEREILRQLREAYNQCLNWNLTGDNMRLLMRFVVLAAKRVYAQTRIGEKPVSVVSLAIQKLLATKLSRRSRVLLIGAGQTNNLVSKFLAKHDFQNITVFNRTFAKAQRLAQRFENGKALKLDEIEYFEEGFDIIFTCTGAAEPIVSTNLYKKLLKEDQGQKLIIDLAIPNDVDRKVASSFDVNYVGVEDLRQLAKENLAFREREVTNAQVLLTEEIEIFKQQFRQRQLEVAMREIPTKIKEVKTKAMNEVFKKELENLDSETLELMERMLSYMEKKCISIPMTVAKKAVVENG